MEKNGNVPQLRFPGFEGEWVESSIGRFSSIKSGSTPLRSNSAFFEGGKIPWVKTTDLNNSFIFETEECITPLAKARINPVGSVLVAMYGGFNQIGRTGYLMVPAATNQALSVINPDLEMIRPMYLLIWLNAKVDYWKNIASSSRKDPNITGSDVARFPIAFPTLPEQTKIADFLSAVDEKLQALQRKKALLTDYKKGMMQQIFTQSLRFKDDAGHDFPDWEEKRLGEVAERVKTKNRDNLIDCVLTNSATQGIVSQCDYFDRDIANPNNLQGYYVVSIDDFVYNPRISVKAPVGPIKRNKLMLGVMSPLYSIFRFKVDHLGYFEYYFETSEWHEYLESVANVGVRFDRMNVTTADFFNMPIPFPIAGERAKIAAFLSALDEKIQATQQAIDRTSAWKKGLLQQLFV